MSLDRRDYERHERARSAMRVNPDPRLESLINYALKAILPKLPGHEYDFWREWALQWIGGVRSPALCVEIGRQCFAKEEQLVWHTLGQLAWGAKEACYRLPQSGWLVIRYIGDAMADFGISFPDGPFLIGSSVPVAAPAIDAMLTD